MSLELRQWVELSLSRLAGLLGTAEGLHYIGGSDVLPPPIDREQERALEFFRALNGAGNPTGDGDEA